MYDELFSELATLVRERGASVAEMESLSIRNPHETYSVEGLRWVIDQLREFTVKRYRESL